METLFILKEIIIKKHITDTTVQKTGNKGDYSLQQGNIYFNDQNNTGKIANFIKATRGISPTGDTGSSNIPPIRNAFMYVGTSGNNFEINVIVRFEGTNTIQIINLTFITEDSGTKIVFLDRWVNFVINYHCLMANGIQKLKLIKKLFTALHQQNGLY